MFVFNNQCDLAYSPCFRSEVAFCKIEGLARPRRRLAPSWKAGGSHVIAPLAAGLLIVFAAIAAMALLAPHRVAATTVHRDSLVMPASQAIAAPLNQMKIAPAEAHRDVTDLRMLVGDQSAD